MDTTTAVFRAVSDPVRRSILDLLAEGERAAGELLAHFSFSQPALSRQELQYDEAPDFGSPTTIPVPIANQRYEAHTPAPGTYYWRVRVSHTGQGWSAWSNVQSVQVSGVRSGSTIRPTIR